MQGGVKKKKKRIGSLKAKNEVTYLDCKRQGGRSGGRRGPATLLEDSSNFQIKAMRIQVAGAASFLGRDNRRLTWMINIWLTSQCKQMEVDAGTLYALKLTAR